MLAPKPSVKAVYTMFLCKSHPGTKIASISRQTTTKLMYWQIDDFYSVKGLITVRLVATLRIAGYWMVDSNMKWNFKSYAQRATVCIGWSTTVPDYWKINVPILDSKSFKASGNVKTVPGHKTNSMFLMPHPVSVIILHFAILLTSGTKVMSKVAALLTFPFFMKLPCGAWLHARVALYLKLHLWPSECAVGWVIAPICNFLEGQATGAVISERWLVNMGSKNGISRCTRTSQRAWDEAILCYNIHDWAGLDCLYCEITWINLP